MGREAGSEPGPREGVTWLPAGPGLPARVVGRCQSGGRRWQRGPGPGALQGWVSSHGAGPPREDGGGRELRQRQVATPFCGQSGSGHLGRLQWAHGAQKRKPGPGEAEGAPRPGPVPRLRVKAIPRVLRARLGGRGRWGRTRPLGRSALCDCRQVAGALWSPRGIGGLRGERVEEAAGTCSLGQHRPRGAQDPVPGRAAADPRPVPTWWGLGSGHWWPCPPLAPAVACQRGGAWGRASYGGGSGAQEGRGAGPGPLRGEVATPGPVRRGLGTALCGSGRRFVVGGKEVRVSAAA